MAFFSKNLKHLRETRKLSQNKLAELVGVNQTTIARWESEEISPNLNNLLDLAKFLHISLSDLTDRDLTNDIHFDKDNEIQLLFNKFKDLSDADRELISGLIDTRRKQIDKELGEEE